jgi:PTH2 family peptidyl-tRNA hydrolase
MTTPLATELDHKQAIVLRKDLNMRKGKMVAQGAHASLAAILGLKDTAASSDSTLVIRLDERTRPWLVGRFKKICLSVNSEQELLDIYDKAQVSGMVCSLIQDAGLTEFGGVPTYTAVAIGPDRAEIVDAITGNLTLL